MNGYHETNIESFNMYDNKLTEAFNTNLKKNGEQFQLILIQRTSYDSHDASEGDEMGQMHSTAAGMSMYCIRIDQVSDFSSRRPKTR